MTSDRRDFLKQITLATAAAGGSAVIRPLGAEDLSRAANFAGNRRATWDMSWTEQLQRTQYKAVFDSPALSDGSALDLAAGIQDDFKEVYGSDDVVRMVIVMRQLGQVMAFNDDLWDRYAIGEERKVNDPLTKQPARRNPCTRALPGEPAWAAAAKLESMRARGAIFLVCNRALMNWAAGAAERTKKDVEEIRSEVRSGLVPGAVLMPTGIFALARAQNAGCAYMKGA
jgi:intracellular sulfur oxidation DsrE/DsrF family protein